MKDTRPSTLDIINEQQKAVKQRIDHTWAMICGITGTTDDDGAWMRAEREIGNLVSTLDRQARAIKIAMYAKLDKVMRDNAKVQQPPQRRTQSQRSSV